MKQLKECLQTALLSLLEDKLMTEYKLIYLKKLKFACLHEKKCWKIMFQAIPCFNMKEFEVAWQCK
jgi:hypothetical protein